MELSYRPCLTGFCLLAPTIKLAQSPVPPIGLHCAYLLIIPTAALMGAAAANKSGYL